MSGVSICFTRSQWRRSFLTLCRCCMTQYNRLNYSTNSISVVHLATLVWTNVCTTDKMSLCTNLWGYLSPHNKRKWRKMEGRGWKNHGADHFFSMLFSMLKVQSVTATWFCLWLSLWGRDRKIGEMNAQIKSCPYCTLVSNGYDRIDGWNIKHN